MIAARTHPTSAATATDALAVCLDETGRVDLDRIAALLGVDPGEAAAALGDMAFQDPANGVWDTAERYLSGHVRTKLAAARAAAAADDPAWLRNVAALEAVHPRELTAEEIDGRLGAAWIPAGDVQAFVDELFPHHQVRVEHAPLTATWAVSGGARYGLAMTSVWATTRADAATLLESSLNQKPHTVYDPLPDSNRRVVNANETMLAREAQTKLGERFAGWLWEDPQRTARLAQVYNERFNALPLLGRGRPRARHLGRSGEVCPDSVRLV